jgi:hypothetical protein
MNKSQRLLGTFLLLIGTVIICAIILEVLCAIFFPHYNPSGKLAIYRDENGTLLMKKNSKGRARNNDGDFDVTYSINKYGFLDKKDLRNATARDIFVVGDSFAFAAGVEEDWRFSNLLEKMVGIPVYNISIPGADIDDYEKLVKYSQRNGANINNLIISVCMENDIADYSFKEKVIYKNNIESFDRPGTNQPGYIDIYFNENYTTLGTIKYYMSKKLTSYNVIACRAHNIIFLRNLLIKIGIIDNQLEIINRIEDNYALYSSADKLLQIAKPFKTTIVIFPSRNLWIDDKKYDELMVHKKFVKLLEGHGVTIVDLYPCYNVKNKPLEYYYFQHDGHPNNEGHLKAAEAIWDHWKNP